MQTTVLVLLGPRDPPHRGVTRLPLTKWPRPLTPTVPRRAGSRKQLGGGSGCRFGRGCGTIFSFDPNTGQETSIHTFTSAEGVEPQGLTASNGVLYGTAQHGGGRRGGTIFSIVP